MTMTMTRPVAGTPFKLPRIRDGQPVDQYLGQLTRQLELALNQIAAFTPFGTSFANLPGAPPVAGGLWLNGPVLCFAPPGGAPGQLPTAAPAAGSGLYWNNGGYVCEA